MTEFINKFKKGNTYYDIHAEESVKAQSADTAVSAVTVQTAQSAEGIGNVRKYSGVYGGKQREGLYFTNNSGEGSEAVIELNSKGNFSFESLTKHVNIESAKGVQIKPTTTLIFDSSRRIESGKGNEIQVEAKFDDFGDTAYDGYDGSDEEWAELKINSRNLDLRCHEHGGIALQIAGKDKKGNENKIKFESDRTTPISEAAVYNGEGGKGLEFGTFNNLHSSLFTKDYRFNKNGKVFAVTRGPLETNDKGKTDYPTQNDDFKDIINETTASATWQSIVTVAEKYKDLPDFTTESDVQALITERAAELAGGGAISLDGYATERYVQDYVSAHGGGGGGTGLIAGNGITIDEGTISVNGWANIAPLSALTKDIKALKSLEISDKGNLQLENKGDFSFEALTDANDENNNLVPKGEKVVSDNLGYYEADDAYFYKAKVDGAKLFDGTEVCAKTIVFMADVTGNTEELAYYENPDYYYKAKYDTVDYNNNPVSAKGVVYKSTMVEDDEEAFYTDKNKYGYKCKVNGALDENENEVEKGVVIDKSNITNEVYYKSNSTEWEKVMTWERVDVWEKSPIWERNACNINIETDSKIKLDGEKLEVFFKENEDTGEMDPMKSITIVGTEMIPLVNQFAFERSVSKNGVETGCDPIISFTYKNNVKDITKVPDFDAFKAGWLTKHSLPKTDEELHEIYERLLNEPESPSSSTKLSTLLGLVNRVSTLEATIAELTARIEALEGGLIESK